jgi:prophage regulatory protein
MNLTIATGSESLCIEQSELQRWLRANRSRLEHRRGDQLLLSYEDLKPLGIHYSRMTLWRRMKDGTFPKAIKLGGNRIAWRKDELLAWLDALERVG